LKITEKKAALGVVDTDRQEVESVETVKKRIERGIDVFGDDMCINPIVGYAFRKGKWHFKSCKVMVDAARASNGAQFNLASTTTVVHTPGA